MVVPRKALCAHTVACKLLPATPVSGLRLPLFQPTMNAENALSVLTPPWMLLSSCCGCAVWGWQLLSAVPFLWRACWPSEQQRTNNKTGLSSSIFKTRSWAVLHSLYFSEPVLHPFTPSNILSFHSVHFRVWSGVPPPGSQLVSCLVHGLGEVGISSCSSRTLSHAGRILTQFVLLSEHLCR